MNSHPEMLFIVESAVLFSSDRTTYAQTDPNHEHSTKV